VFKNREEIAKVNSQPFYRTGDTMLEVYMQTLIGGSMLLGHKKMQEKFLTWFNKSNELWWKMNDMPITSNLAEAVGADEDSPLWVFDRMVRDSWNPPTTVAPIVDQDLYNFQQLASPMSPRRMFRTESGYIGLGSEFIQVGDSLGIFKGGRVPLLVRSDDSEKWKLVGSTYIHGMMKGEVYNEEDCKPFWIS
jgi:hypothetical protein